MVRPRIFALRLAHYMSSTYVVKTTWFRTTRMNTEFHFRAVVRGRDMSASKGVRTKG